MRLHPVIDIRRVEYTYKVTFGCRYQRREAYEAAQIIADAFRCRRHDGCAILTVIDTDVFLMTVVSRPAATHRKHNMVLILDEIGQHDVDRRPSTGRGCYARQE